MSLFTEAKAIFETASLCTLPLFNLQKGDGHPVLVLPGFLCGPSSVLTLRLILHNLGYHTHTWTRGRNPGLRYDIYKDLIHQLEHIHSRTGKKVSIIGHSLGGVYGRLLAHTHSDCVRQVITLGSPFKITNDQVDDVDGIVKRLYMFINSDQMTDEIMTLSHKWVSAPHVPSTAIYSEMDKIVHWDYCHDDITDDNEHNTENVHVTNATHVGMTHNPLIVNVISDRLAQSELNWKSFEISSHLSRFYE